MQEVPVNPESLVKLDHTESAMRQHMAQMWPNADLRKGIVGDIGPELVITPKIKEQLEAIKFDAGKVDWTLVPFEALEGMAQVLQFGAKKYAAWNWTEGGGFKWTRILGSCLRHIFAFMRGEDTDPESGLSHISHAQCNLLFLAYYIRNKDKFSKDDRNVR